MGGHSFLFPDLNNFHFNSLYQGHPHKVTVAEMYNTYFRVIILIYYFICVYFNFFLIINIKLIYHALAYVY